MCQSLLTSLCAFPPLQTRKGKRLDEVHTCRQVHTPEAMGLHTHVDMHVLVDM